jgi:hypothetical protein
MKKGKITVMNGLAVAVEGEETFGLVPGGEALNETIKTLNKVGWIVDGELPPFKDKGKYTIPIVKSE